MQVVVHFYHEEFMRCKIMDMHLSEVAKEHPECVFVSLNAQKVYAFKKGAFFRPETGHPDFADAVLLHQGHARWEADGLRRLFLGRVQDDRARAQVLFPARINARLVVHKMIKAKNSQEKGIQFKKHRKEESDSGSDC